MNSLVNRKKKKTIKNKNFSIIFLLLFIIFFSLDFIGWKTGNKSYVFYYFFRENSDKKQIMEEKERPKVAIIIDDIGNNLKIVKEIVSLKIPITISVLPHLPYSQQAAKLAHSNGLQVMLHQPLEPVNVNNYSLQKGEIISGMSAFQIKRILDNNIKSIPYIEGVNNHMGSKITKDASLMKIILTHLKKKNLFFIDSLTTNHSVAFRIAQELKLKSGRRDVFLDKAEMNNKETGYDFRYTVKMVKELLEIAKKKGKAIGIGHPFYETLKGLKKSLYLIKKSDIKLVNASEIVD